MSNPPLYVAIQIRQHDGTVDAENLYEYHDETTAQAAARAACDAAADHEPDSIEHDPEKCGCTYLGMDMWSCGHMDNDTEGGEDA